MVDFLGYELLRAIDAFARGVRSQLGLCVAAESLLAIFAIARGVDARSTCRHIASWIGDGTPPEADHVSRERRVVWLSTTTTNKMTSIRCQNAHSYASARRINNCISCRVPHRCQTRSSRKATPPFGTLICTGGTTFRRSSTSSAEIPLAAFSNRCDPGHTYGVLRRPVHGSVRESRISIETGPLHSPAGPLDRRTSVLPFAGVMSSMPKLTESM